jgi:hypothetical protein
MKLVPALRILLEEMQTLAGVFTMHLMAHIYRPGLTCMFLIGAVINKPISWK